ncbi:type II toxin-antitoxin system Phd/YefM family antitoxin [bacterium]|nr:type II toxin-antitoxin system Phd/YefM family antitoxin [bacterium]
MKNIWQLQEAKARLSHVVNEAVRRGPQIITRNGIETVMMISVEEYRNLHNKEKKLSGFFNDSPLKGLKLNLKRSDDMSRDIEI